MKDYSVVILTFNSERCIARCLDSLAASFQALGASAEIFVIDNGSRDGTKAAIAGVRFPAGVQLRLIEFDHNTGTTYSRNQGLKQASGRYVIVMDSDAYTNADTLGGVATYLDTHPECGLAVPKLTYADGRFQLSTDVFPTLVRKAQRFLFLKTMEQREMPDMSAPSLADYAISAFWMLPRAVLEKVGLLDEKIFYSPEDVDYCIRVWRAGYRIVYLPQCSMIHDAQEISRAKGLRINKFTLSHIKGMFYLFFKHGYLLSARGLRKQTAR
jgi:GT2 family glycosyltransferase